MSAAMQNTLIRAHADWRVQRFLVDVIRPDGSSERYERMGGSSIDHTLEGMDAAGLGGVVRVVPADLVGVQ